jgi:hypothetical protein
MSASLQENGLNNLAYTVRPNGVAAQAFEPDISAKNRRQGVTMALLPQYFPRRL